MSPEDAAQVEALRLAELKDVLSQYQDAIYKLAFVEMSHGNQDVATQIDQAQIRLKAAMQAIGVRLRTL